MAFTGPHYFWAESAVVWLMSLSQFDIYSVLDAASSLH